MDAMQLTRLTNLVDAERSTPTAPEVFLVLAAYEPFEIQSPCHVADQSISLRAERVDLEDIGIAPVMTGVDHDFKIVVQLLCHVAAELSSEATRGIVTGDAEIDLILRVQHSDLSFFCCGFALVGFSLPEIGNRSSLLPEWGRRSCLPDADVDRFGPLRGWVVLPCSSAPVAPVSPPWHFRCPEECPWAFREFAPSQSTHLEIAKPSSP